MQTTSADRTFEELKYHIEVDEYGTRSFYNSADQLHREEGPAIEWADKSQSWYSNGELHRVDGPAITWPDGSKIWYHNGVKHRTDGPAVEYASGHTEWYVNGVKYDKKQFNVLVKK